MRPSRGVCGPRPASLRAVGTVLVGAACSLLLSWPLALISAPPVRAQPVVGRHPAAPRTAGGEAAGELFPVLRRLAEATWKGKMQFAVGPEMKQAPFVLTGTCRCTLDGDKCTMTNTVVLPNGKERVVVVSGTAGNAMSGAVMRLEPEGDGPYAMLVAEHPASDADMRDMLLIREVSREDDSVVVAQGLTFTGPDEFVKVSHELTAEGVPEGVQMWCFKRDS
mmetsp:Transcript_100961/g.320465  ORF Transcript_100961/g.320465 Transcript_100961/m.320465 type:complete len:222 (-) Transcript_100961:118-783(-)